MNCQEIAYLYAGKNAIYKTATNDFNVRIVGYQCDPHRPYGKQNYSNYICVDVSSSSGIYGILPRVYENTVCFTVPIESICKAKLIHITNLLLISSTSNSLYTLKCRVCHLPARKCSGYVLCSNKKCKVNKVLKNIMNAIPKPHISIYNILKCFVCKKPASNATYPNEVRCNCGNRWEYNIQKYDTVILVSYNSSEPMYWDGARWEHCKEGL